MRNCAAVPGQIAAADRREAPRHRFAALHRSRSPGTPITLTHRRARCSSWRSASSQPPSQSQNAVSGSLVVMNPHTGDILAHGQLSHLRSEPAAAAQARADAAPHAITPSRVPFEPGSVFKVITLSAALETTNLQSGEPHRLPWRRAQAARPRDPRFAPRHTGSSRWRRCSRNPAISERSRSGSASASRTCTTMSASSASDRRPGSDCRPNRAASSAS